MIYFDLTYDLKNDTFGLKTNAKEEVIEELLSEYLRTQMGAGKDDSTPSEKDEYHIMIQLDLSDDSFRVKSDTGNKGLTTGLVMHYLQKRGQKVDA